MCLPDDAWEISVEDHRPVLYLKRATTDTDWARAKLYASRIRELGYRPNLAKRIHVDQSVLELISISRVLSFPNLQSLMWEKESLPLLGLFLGPSLMELNIDFPNDPHYLVPADDLSIPSRFEIRPVIRSAP